MDTLVASRRKIAVVGSIMVDLVTRCRRYPERGETLEAESFSAVPGGKGANQAAAAARMGCSVSLIGAVGRDHLAETALGLLRSFGVDTSCVLQSGSSATGIASIIIDGSSENTILVTRGANNDLDRAHLDQCAETIGQADALLVQLETKLPVVEYAMQLAHQTGIPILLDPAPAQQIPDSFLALADILVPNMQEAWTLSQIKQGTLEAAINASSVLRRRGARQVIVKRGAEGCLLSTSEICTALTGLQIEAVDTVGAGDCFAGALMARWLKTRDLVDACRFANIAAALKVQRHGAQAGLPSLQEVETVFDST